MKIISEISPLKTLDNNRISHNLEIQKITIKLNDKKETQETFT